MFQIMRGGAVSRRCRDRVAPGRRSGRPVHSGGVRNRIVFDYFTLDGVVNNDPNFNTYIVLPSIDALQEFKVQSGVYSCRVRL